jgi:hypothetical protein
MLLAMVVGMVVLGPLWPELHGSTELHLLVMATNMTLRMALWMLPAKLRRPSEYLCHPFRSARPAR